MLIDKVHWLGHSSFLLEGLKTVIIDPFQITTSKKADILLISHEHYDHCSVEDIKKVIQPFTVILTVPGNQSKLAAFAEKIAEIKIVKPGDKVSALGIIIEAVPAYNINKNFHPKSNEWVGFVITLGTEQLYFAADTDLIPEMKDIKCDIALLPVSGTYVMTAEEAAKAASIIAPKIAVPMHYGNIVGTEKDAERFKQLCQCEVRILKKE